MAGIGFELRKVLKKDSILSLVKVFGYSAMLSAGPWVISIIAIMAVGFISISTTGKISESVQFQIVVTYAIALASSLIITGFIQLPYTRYVADLIYKKEERKVLPSFFGAILMSWIAGIPFIAIFVCFVFPEQGSVFKLGVASVFLVLCAVWIANILATSLKYYKGVIVGYALSYGFIVAASYFAGKDINLLLIIFLAGNTMLLAILMSLIIKTYESNQFWNLHFFSGKKFYWTLGFAGLFYNLGIWVDKFIFWYNPLTGHPVIGKLHASIPYDLPIFMAYLSIIPGMAIFFFRLEADFADKYERFYDAVRQDGTLSIIDRYHNEMVETIRYAVHEILIIQAIVDIIIFLMAPKIFDLLHIPQLYLGLFYILTIGAMLQLCFMAILALLNYLDRRKEAMILSLLFFVLNALLTYISIYLGPSFFGYGYALSLLVSFIASLFVIRHVMEELEYETFMLR